MRKIQVVTLILGTFAIMSASGCNWLEQLPKDVTIEGGDSNAREVTADFVTHMRNRDTRRIALLETKPQNTTEWPDTLKAARRLTEYYTPEFQEKIRIKINKPNVSPLAEHVCFSFGKPEKRLRFRLVRSTRKDEWQLYIISILSMDKDKPRKDWNVFCAGAINA